MCVCFQTSFGEVMVHPMYLFPWPSFVVFQVPALEFNFKILSHLAHVYSFFF